MSGRGGLEIDMRFNTADDSYEADIVGWPEDQAARLRRVAAGEAPPGGAGVDWPNVAEEIEGVDRTLGACVDGACLARTISTI